MDLKDKIERHGRSFMRDNIFSIVRMFVVLAIVAYLIGGELDQLIIVTMIAYATIIGSMTYKKNKREKKYFNFEEGNPLYDELTEYGDPNQIIESINNEVNEGRVVYNALGKPNKTSPETLITEKYFVHMNKTSSIIPLEKVVCAYLYDKATKGTPPEKFLPTYFKPIHLIITYGNRKEGYFIYSSLAYKDVLDILNNKLNCKINYTRELGTLFNTDYDAFLLKVAELKGN